MTTQTSAREPLLGKDDWKLSMRISRKPRSSTGNLPMRSMLVHRLRTRAKAVLRLPLSQGLNSSSYGRFCEPCGEWTRVTGATESFTCDGCGRVYVIEFAVYAVVPGSEPGN